MPLYIVVKTLLFSESSRLQGEDVPSISGWLLIGLLAFSLLIGLASVAPAAMASAGEKTGIELKPAIEVKPVILTSIKPLTMIATAVLGDQVEIRQLLPDQEIPHHYALRVSDRRLFDQGQLVLWIGPELETFMAALVAEREPRSVITAAELNGIVWPEAVERGRDYHLWLNPDNALLIARTLVRQVGEFSGVNKAVLKARLQKFEDEITTFKQTSSERLLPLKDNKFIVDHDAFRHFTETFGLHGAGYLRDSSGLEIGARARAKIMSQEGIRSVIAEPESRLDRLQGLAIKWKAKLAIIDPLGAEVMLTRETLPNEDSKRSSSAYIRMLSGVTQAFYHCLQGE